ncbi:hypothetical protein Anas_13888 [Armadillidium nasatum]|uniref:Ig-like domain-containing protein n=1 Tax=Armadillidium nasatum TaxID=96803 RepID=A0A5N5T5H0_9CRUS|nr:hypothetical protein Anas_13888 [Armadillidium nasatum]
MIPPEVIAKETEEGYYDRSAVITCHIQTLVPFNVTWKKNGKYIAGPYRYPQSAEIRHVIERPTSREEGIYTCLASNIAGSSFANVFLDIKGKIQDISTLKIYNIFQNINNIIF